MALAGKRPARRLPQARACNDADLYGVHARRPRQVGARVGGRCWRDGLRMLEPCHRTSTAPNFSNLGHATIHKKILAPKLARPARAGTDHAQRDRHSSRTRRPVQDVLHFQTTDARLADAIAERQKALDALERRSQNAWRRKSSDASNPDEDDPKNDARDDSYEAAVRRRDEEYRQAVERSQSAWRMKPARANAVERQGESGHAVLHCKCLLMTQSGHRSPHFQCYFDPVRCVVLT